MLIDDQADEAAACETGPAFEDRRLIKPFGMGEDFVHIGIPRRYGTSKKRTHVPKCTLRYGFLSGV
jgi:hypothetical protein